MDTPWREKDGAIEVRVRLTPKSSRDAIDGVERLADGACVLKARVRAVPEKGKANAALCRLLAKALSVPRSSVSVTGGARARIKSVTIAADPATTERELAVLFGNDRKGACRAVRQRGEVTNSSIRRGGRSR